MMEEESMKKDRLIGVILTIMITASFLSSAAAQTGNIVIDRTTRVKALNDYALLTRDVIQRSWTTPVSIEVDGAVKGKIAVDYTIDNRGKLRSVNVTRSSGNQEMDRSLLSAIKNAGSFPPMPDGIDANTITIKANFIVADVPTVPVLTVAQNVKKNDVQAGPKQEPKKFQWGLPAGDPGRGVLSTDFSNEKVPNKTKYKWGK
jgi:TonB family protein